MRIVCIGDSMTHKGEGLSERHFEDFLPGLPLDFYPKHLAHLMRAEVHSFSAFANNHDGRVMPTIMNWADRACHVLEPDLLVVQGGGDDLEPNRANASIGSVLSAFDKIHYAAKKAKVNCLILLIPTAHKSVTDVAGNKRRAVNEALRLDYPGETLDYYQHLHGVSALLSEDGFHPNDAGCLLMAGLIASKLKELSWLG